MLALHSYLALDVEASGHVTRLLQKGVEHERLPDAEAAGEAVVLLDVRQSAGESGGRHGAAVQGELSTDPQLTPAATVAQHVQQRSTLSLCGESR